MSAKPGFSEVCKDWCSSSSAIVRPNGYTKLGAWCPEISKDRMRPDFPVPSNSSSDRFTISRSDRPDAHPERQSNYTSTSSKRFSKKWGPRAGSPSDVSLQKPATQDVPDRYQLYRVFDFADSPRLYVLSGSLRELCRLEPLQYSAIEPTPPE